MSDLQHPDFLAAVNGHRMNVYGVATSSIWSDIALTIGEHAYRLLRPQAEEVHMNLCDFQVLHVQVASTAQGVPQLLQIQADLDLLNSLMSIAWYNVDPKSGERSPEHFASGTVRFEDPQRWHAEWSRVSHLVTGRIEALEQMAQSGHASRLSKNLAYTLFKNVVDYAEEFRGMDKVILNDYEAVAEVTLSNDRHGTWHTPPHWIDSVCHLAGFIMNGSDASNTRDFFYVTPGSESLRFSKPLEAGGHYQSYVRMFPLAVEAGHMHAGDVYILQDGVIVAMLSQIRFRRVPRSLMDRFFAPVDTKSAHDSAPESCTLNASSARLCQAPAAKTGSLPSSASSIKAASTLSLSMQNNHYIAPGIGGKAMPILRGPSGPAVSRQVLRRWTLSAIH